MAFSSTILLLINIFKYKFRLPPDWSDVESQQSDVSVNNTSRRYRLQREAKEKLVRENEESQANVDLSKNSKIPEKTVAIESIPAPNTIIPNAAMKTSTQPSFTTSEQELTGSEELAFLDAGLSTRRQPLPSSSIESDSLEDVWQSHGSSLSSESLEEETQGAALFM